MTFRIASHEHIDYLCGAFRDALVSKGLHLHTYNLSFKEICGALFASALLIL